MSKSYRFLFAVNSIVSTDGTIPKSISSPLKLLISSVLRFGVLQYRDFKRSFSPPIDSKEIFTDSRASPDIEKSTSSLRSQYIEISFNRGNAPILRLVSGLYLNVKSYNFIQACISNEVISLDEQFNLVSSVLLLRSISRMLLLCIYISSSLGDLWT